MQQPTSPDVDRSTDRHEWAQEMTTDGGHACPLCGFSAAEETSVYAHLQTSHRKSVIARAVLEDPGGDS